MPGVRADAIAAVRPPALAPQARIAVIAPASPIPRDRLDAGLATLRSWGYEPVEAAHLRDSDGGFLAGDDHARAADLSDAFADPDIHAVWVARGGYGSTRMVDLVRWRHLRDRPKPLLGFSDATAVHAAAWHRTGTVGLHSPVVVQLGELQPDGSAAAWLRSLLAGGAGVLPVAPEDLRCVSPGSATGPVVGGNLAVLCSLIGTVDEVDTRGAILFLEDVGEVPYRIDRMLIQLLRAGALDEVEAIVTGRFTGATVRGAMPPRTVDDVLEDTLGHLGIPVLSGLPVGHGPGSLTLPLGSRATVDAVARTVELTDPPLVPRARLA